LREYFVEIEEGFDFAAEGADVILNHWVRLLETTFCEAVWVVISGAAYLVQHNLLLGHYSRRLGFEGRQRYA
jgi:hypothetical protein